MASAHRSSRRSPPFPIGTDQPGVDRVWDTGQVGRVWTSDITYLSTGQGWVYLCAGRDGCSRRVIGWAMADHTCTELVSAGLNMFVVFRGQRPPKVVAAAAGEPNIAGKLKAGHDMNGRNYRVHLDGFNRLAYLKDEVGNSPRLNLRGANGPVVDQVPAIAEPGQLHH